MKNYILCSFFIASICSGEPIDTVINNGKTALQQKNKENAIAHLTHALHREPDNPEALYYLGLVYHCALDGDNALYYLRKSYEQNPQHAPYIYAYALAAFHAGEFQFARDVIEKHFGAEPNNEELRKKLLPLYLRDMDWYYATKLCQTRDLWWYNKDIYNKIVLLDLSSQWNGCGDIMQLVRYAIHLNKKGAYVVAYVRKELVPLLSLCPYLADVVECTQSKPIHDEEYALTIDRLTIIMRDTLYASSQDVPYLYADPQLQSQWKENFSNQNGLKVGFCFQSTKMRDFFSDAIMPGPRGMYARELTPLFELHNIQFYSLQVGETDQLSQLQQYPNVHIFPELDAQSGPFMDTAAIIKQLDLVITVDTSIAHLAGGIGIPVWVMLPYAADFRWFANRDDSPWYPTMQLFRQSKQGNWHDVIARVKQELEQLNR